MKNVTLYTASGELVTVVEVPPWLPGKDPEVIMWGSRIFVLVHSTMRYIEGMMWVVPLKEEPPYPSADPDDYRTSER